MALETVLNCPQWHSRPATGRYICRTEREISLQCCPVSDPTTLWMLQESRIPSGFLRPLSFHGPTTDFTQRDKRKDRLAMEADRKELEKTKEKM
jgi:hypothetical protein